MTEIPEKTDNVMSTGFTKLDFCAADNMLYAFNGTNLYRYSSLTESFDTAFNGAGTIISETWDPADIAFLSDSNDVFLPTGQSERVVFVDRQQEIATEKSGLRRNFYSSASRYRDNQLFANGVGEEYNNTIYLLNVSLNGTETEVVKISDKNSGAIAFDFADNLYISDFAPIWDGQKLGNVDIYRIARWQLDAFLEDSSFGIVPELIVNNVVLAGSDSMTIDGDYNIYMSSYVGIAKIVPTDDPNDFEVSAIDGNIYAPPYGLPPPNVRFCGITSDIKSGTIYYGRSVLNQYVFEPYVLAQIQTIPAVEWSGDLDGDGIIDFYDLYLLQQDYLCSGEHLKGDIDDDGFVDFQDYIIFADQWNDKARWYKGN
ncbi:MAG: hypothetical protein BWY69_00466 [Planctomycetes bacterium ADurb.Bin401]|nr:MAG: hypothetical protein BWY69_00466 [Planctomycetes bacterium ADurb.Bin401]